MLQAGLSDPKKEKMKNPKKKNVNYKLEYFKLIYLLNKYRVSGEDPPARLLKQIREIEPLAKINRENPGPTL